VRGTRQAGGSGHRVTEEDVAETIFSLVTSNPFVTGETIVIDGGYAATS
jgi:3-oxoacyl-[acyl-carrier protein] reductase